jgi:hypothetical protein
VATWSTTTWPVCGSTPYRMRSGSRTGAVGAPGPRQGVVSHQLPECPYILYGESQDIPSSAARRRCRSSGHLMSRTQLGHFPLGSQRVHLRMASPTAVREDRCQDQPHLRAAPTGPWPCHHLCGARAIRPDSTQCLECLERGCGWVALWLCLSCGWMACSDDSPTSTPSPTIKRPTIPSPSRWSMAIANAGVMSISAPSDSVSIVGPHTADSGGITIGRREM